MSLDSEMLGSVTPPSGDATITVGAEYVAVTHGLGLTPAESKLLVKVKDDLGGRDFWISNIGATTFRINISSADLSSHSFKWTYFRR